MIRRFDTFTYEQATDLLGRLNNPQTVVDLGAGLRTGPVSLQVAKIPCEVLTSVEGFFPYLASLENTPVAAKVHNVIHADICNVELDKTDAVFMLDVLEHLTKEDGTKLISKLQALAKSIVVFIPLGDTIGYSNDFQNMGNTLLQTHHSAWEASDLAELGFDVDIYTAFHSHVKPNQVTDAAWAVWRTAELDPNLIAA